VVSAPHSSDELVPDSLAELSIDGQLKVLIVDDEEPIRMIMERALTASGMSVQVAVNGSQALALLANGARFNAVVTDLHMPELDGIGFMRAVRAADLDVPVIVLTGHASVDSAIAA